jgi:hypothetical protein
LAGAASLVSGAPRGKVFLAFDLLRPSAIGGLTSNLGGCAQSWSCRGDVHRLLLHDYLWHGSFARAFLIVPVVMLLMGIGIWLFMPGHKGKEPDAIAV